MALQKPLKIYFIGFILLLILSLIIGYFEIKQYSFFGLSLTVNCPYGGEIGPNGELINARHICPPDGGNRDWLLISIFSIIVLICYSLVYWLVYIFILFFRRLQRYYLIE